MEQPSRLSVLVATLFFHCAPSLKEVTLPSYRTIYTSEPNAQFIADYLKQYRCIGVAQRALQSETPDKMEERARQDYGEHCQGNVTTLNYAQNGDITLAFQPPPE